MVDIMARKEDTYTQGSEGSRICSSNIRRYPEDFTKPRDEFSPSTTDHIMDVPPSEYKSATDSEMIRRESNRNRDRKKRWGVITSPIATDTDSDAEAAADRNNGKVLNKIK